MNIACLAWGSLVWNPKDLPIQRCWFDDGPFVPVEFTRQSKDGRITLVVDKNAEPVRVLWARMTLTDLEGAMKALSDREGITEADWKSRIGNWEAGNPAPKDIVSLAAWARKHTELTLLFGLRWDRSTPRKVRLSSPRSDHPSSGF